MFDGVTGKSLIRAEGVTLTMDGCTVKNCNMTDGKGGLIRLESTTSNIVNTSFINNVSTSGYAIITQNYNSDNSESDMNIGNCVFSGNSVNAPGVVHVDTGDVAAIKNTEFIGNTVATNGNAAVAYMGWGNGQEVSGCTFERNTVTTSHATTKRFASAIFCDGCVVKDNAFINNTATRNGETISTVVAVGAYYGEANISANYWNNGSKPVDGADYTVEYTNQTVTNDSYYATRNEDGTLAGLVTIKKLPNAEVSVLEPITLEAGSYTMWPSGDDKIDRPLEIVMNFKANDTLEECLTGGYSQWLVDFNLTFTGLTTGSITADNCYLAGKYGDAGAYGDLGWVVIPADDMELEEGVSYPVVAAYDATLNYKDICNSVKDFTAAIHVDQAIIDANPNFKVELSLVMTNPNDASDKLVIGEPAVYTAEDLKNEVVVAAIGTKKYSSLADAIAAAEAGDIITLLDDIELENAIVIAKDKNITLDLAGYTVTYNSTTQGEAMITNKGTLTINDTVGTGVINYNYTGAADPNYGKGNYTISNAGTLTVNGGKITIANLSSHAKYPIDNNSTTGDAILVINGGHLYNYNTSAIRQFCNSTTYKNSVTINGGLVEGYSAIWVQNPGSKTVNGSLTITGGEIRTTAKAYVNGTSELKDVSSAIYCTIAGKVGAWDADSAVSITGGTFNENVYLATNAPETIAVDKTNATFNGKLELPEEEIDETVIFGTPFYMIDLPMVDNQYQVNLYSGIDSLNYKEVGFKVYDKNDNILGKSSTDTVYKSIKGSNMTIVASEFNMFRIFGVEVFFGTAWDNTEIYFRPYAIDMNGKEILGKKYPIADIYTK